MASVDPGTERAVDVAVDGRRNCNRQLLALDADRTGISTQVAKLWWQQRRCRSRDEHGRADLLGRRLDARSGVHGIADRRVVEAVLVADVADHCRTAVHADADRERCEAEQLALRVAL